ncbi:ComF family protein [Geopsychrobacter electrodiphilus]|uniref:ComF family protein n=1 Tax=Geopsychrobacter electrodiphilus TaxID=225196 RepID=UPI000366C12F|nr:ComF family protein [Geopsychrobacter electrodiphilus]
MVGQQISGLVDLLFPPVCPICRVLLRGASSPFCLSCVSNISPLPAGRCSRCALPFVSENSSAHLCAECCRKPPCFSQVSAAGLYAGSLKTALQRFKYSGAIDLDRPLVSLLLPRVSSVDRDDIIVPVPMHVSRLRQRGYNQSLLLAKMLAFKLRRPLCSQVLQRIKDNPPQQGLGARQRALNLGGAFVSPRRLDGRGILLVDDVMTTGATIRACAQALMVAGSGQVRVAVIARAPRH